MIHTAIDQSLKTLQTQTRAERKRAAREQEKSKAVYTMTNQQLENYKRNALEIARKEFEVEIITMRRKWVGLVIDSVITSMMIVLHDNYGFGAKRLQDVQERAESQLECISAGTLTLEELKEVLKRLNEKAVVPVVLKGKGSYED